MIKKITLLTFLSVFAFIVSAPDVMALLVTDTYTVNVILDAPDEEKQEGETSKEKDIKIFEISDFCTVNDNELNKKKRFFNKQKYPSVYLKMIFPPPELS